MTRKFLLAACGALLVCVWSITGIAQNKPRPDRVFTSELEGVWMHDAYLEVLKKTRMPHLAAKKQKPMVIAIKREGRVYPYVATDFEKATLMVILALEPDIKPDSYRLVLGKKNEPTAARDAVYIWFKGTRDEDRKFRKLAFKEELIMKGRWGNYEHVGMELGPVINGIVLAGKYKDQSGKNWEFSDEGQAKFPDQSFYYEVSLNDRKADCEYFEAEDLSSESGIVYYGYAWKDGKLNLFRANVKKDRVRCEAKPFAELTPQ